MLWPRTEESPRHIVTRPVTRDNPDQELCVGGQIPDRFDDVKIRTVNICVSDAGFHEVGIIGSEMNRNL